MKMLILVFGMMLCIFTQTISSTTVNGRFVVTGTDSMRVAVLVQINSNSGTDRLGGATIVLGFNSSLINLPGTLQRNTDYIFHNFSGGNYSLATVTKPMSDRVWINIDLPYNNSNNGTAVAGSEGWTDVATIYFHVQNFSDSISLYWMPESPFWGIYDDDNSTLWESGNFEALNSYINTDFTPPLLLNAVLLDNTTLELDFSEPMDQSSAEDISNYNISNNINVLNAVRSSNEMTVTLTTSEHLPGLDYEVTADNVKDAAGNIISPDNNSFEYEFVSDTTAPYIEGVTVNNQQTLILHFSKRLDVNSAKNKNNYSISDNISVNQVQVLPDSSGVQLKTSKHGEDKHYVVTAVNIKDRSGNLINPNPGTGNYKTPAKRKGNPKMNGITEAKSSSWYQALTPDKTIDGQGMSFPSSRWQSGSQMPVSIEFDLGEINPVDSLRVSFHKWESGKLYEYSVLVSEDSVNWNTVLDRSWSESLEWSETRFDSVNARYVKLELHRSNQSPFASIWEVEVYGSDNTSSTGEPEVKIPVAYALEQNYPNPFNPGTKIRWQAPEDSRQTLKVYDILGNEIATLVDEHRSEGTHEVYFDASGLASGVYVYRLIAGNHVETKKMMLLR